MSMVDILYGVTMQEPGVSVPVAVKFDDVHEFTESAEPVAAG
jgi:chromosome segregation ATPase